MSTQASYANLSFEELSRLGSVPSGPDAGTRSAFLSHLQSLGLPSVLDDRFAVVDASVAEVRSYREFCGMLLDPHGPLHPIDEVCACLYLLRRHETFDAIALSLHQVQARLSRVLVDHPVLLHPRMVYRFPMTSGDEWLTLACAIAESSAASLPMVEHGLSQQEVERFAANHSVLASLTIAGSSSIRAADFRGRTPLQIATSNGHNNAPATPGATRGAFLCSLLRLSNLPGSSLSKGLIPAAHKASAGDTLYQSLVNTFWGVLGIGGWTPGVTRAEFVKAMQGASPFVEEREPGPSPVVPSGAARGAGASEQGVFCHFLALKIDADLFGDFRRDPRSFHDFPPLDRSTMCQRTRDVIELLVDIGSFESRALAARWLARSSVGHGRADGDFVPSCSLACVLGFLEAVEEHGVSLEALDPQAVGRQRSSVAQEGLTTWCTAIEVFNAESSMKRVIAAHGDEPIDATSPRRRTASL
jgi:hypothetical protein